MKHHTLVLALVCIVALTACNRLPSNIIELPLDQQIEATKRYYQGRGAWNSYQAQVGISLHGYAGAEAMLPYLRGEEGIPVGVAISVAYQVQLRGCSLAGTEVERALREVARTADFDVDRENAESALLVIQKDIKAPDGFDIHGPGACGSDSLDPAQRTSELRQVERPT